MLPVGKEMMQPGDATMLGREMAERRGMAAPSPFPAWSGREPRRLEVRTGDRFRQVEPPGHTYSVVRVIRPRSGHPHAWLRPVDGPIRRPAHVLRSLEALGDDASFVRVPDARGKRHLRVVTSRQAVGA